ncbi:hypothetical protein C8R47DRAFT_1084282 [Mycena vitilis]|nr:hypothetical protein C8R47DRAFT_1084282 [Mycena vitilis]
MSPPTRHPTPQPVRKERPTCPNRAPTLPNADSRPTTPPTDNTRAKDQRPTARADDAGSGTTTNDAACLILQTDPTFSTLCPAPSTGSPGISNYALHHEVRPASRDTITQKARDVALRANPPKHSANPKTAIRHTDAIPHQQVTIITRRTTRFQRIAACRGATPCARSRAREDMKHEIVG